MAFFAAKGRPGGWLPGAATVVVAPRCVAAAQAALPC